MTDPIDPPERTDWGPCQVDGCSHPAIPCWLPDNEGSGEPDELLCAEHAPAHSYCASCGQFWGGIESFEMRPSGLCDNCHDDAVRDEHWDDDWGFDDDDDYDEDLRGIHL